QRFVEVAFSEPVSIRRVRLVLGRCGQMEPPPRPIRPLDRVHGTLHLMHSGGGGRFRPLEILEARPPVALQLGAIEERGPVLLVDTTPMQALRIVLPQTGRWSIAELRID